MDFSHTSLNLNRMPRSWKITLLTTVLCAIGCAKLYRSIWFAFEWEYILTISQPVNWWFILNTSLLSVIGSFLVGWWLWSGHRLSAYAYWIWFILFSVLFWVEKLILPASSTAQTGWLFDLGLQVLFWFVSLWLLKPKFPASPPPKEKSDV